MVSNDYIKKVYELYSQYHSYDKVGEVLGVKPSTVRRNVTRYNALYGLREQDKKTEIKNTLVKEQSNYWKNKYNSLLKETSLENKLFDLFKNNVKKFSDVEIKNKNDKQIETNEEIVLLLSDIHTGETVEGDAILNINEYNLEITEQRINLLYNKFMKMIESHQLKNRCQKLNIWILGDIVSGIIHEELIQNVTIVDEILFISNLLSNLIIKLATEFSSIEVCGVIGNHGRIFKKYHFKNKYNNFDYIVYKFIETKCENISNITFNIPKSPVILKQIYDYLFLIHHGDNKVQSYAGIPFYGLRRMDTQATQTISYNKNMYLHYQVIGHYHTSNALEKIGGKIIMNGSIMGADEFSFGNSFTMSEPKQIMFLIDKNEGVYSIFDINLKTI